jgi:hypothetical protein
MQCLKGLLRREDCFDAVTDRHAAWICERLAWHKVLPLAAAMQDPHRKKCGDIARTFQAVLLQNMAREEFYYAQVTELFETLDQTGVAFIPFKGPFWSARLYENYYWRHIGDIDLLMTKADAEQAAQQLMTIGYHPDILENSLEEEFVARGELALLPGKDRPRGVPVELHWDLMPSPRFLRKQFMVSSDFTESTTNGRWRDIQFQLPSPEIQLFYHLLHATCQHQFSRFVHITNIVHFLEQFPDLNWKQIHRLALERRALVPIHYGLRFAQAFHPLPGQARRLICKTRPNPVARILAAVLTPEQIPLATVRRGKTRRNVFRVAMSL